MTFHGLFRSLDEVLADYPLPNPDVSKLAGYYGPPLTEEMVREGETILGVKLPSAYLEMLRFQNGGFLAKRRFPTSQPTSWADDHVEVNEFFGLGCQHGLDSPLGSRDMSEIWMYPEGLLWLSGDGHTGFFLDYRSCGPQGEPSVVWLDMETDPDEIFQLAPNFGEFVSKLEVMSDDQP